MSAAPGRTLPLEAREQAVMRVCFDLSPSQRDLEDLGAPERWLLYRTMVRDRLIGMIRAGLPRTEPVIGPETLEASYAEWLANDPPRSRYIRDVVPAFVAFAADSWADTRPVAPDLARYEALVWKVRTAVAPPLRTVDFHFDLRPALNPTLAIAGFDFPVNERREDYQKSPTILAVYRRLADHKPLVFALDPLTADLMRAFQEGTATVTEAVQVVTEKHGVAIDAAFIDRLTTRLARFISEGLVLGSHAR